MQTPSGLLFDTTFRTYSCVGWHEMLGVLACVIPICPFPPINRDWS